VVKRARLVGGTAAADGPAGLVAAAGLAAIGVLVVTRGTVRGEKPVPVRHPGFRRSGDHTAGFPAYRKIASDLEWAQMSRRHYEVAARPMLARLAAAAGIEAVAEEPRPAAGAGRGNGRRAAHCVGRSC
jgi:hypothetical protein